MAVDARVDLSMSCDKCSADLDEADDIYCGKCSGQGLPPHIQRVVDKVRWIGDELRDTKADWRIVERVRELEAELTA